MNNTQKDDRARRERRRDLWEDWARKDRGKK